MYFGKSAMMLQSFVCKIYLYAHTIFSNERISPACTCFIMFIFSHSLILNALLAFWCDIVLCSSADDLFDLFSWFISLNIPSILQLRKEFCSPECRVNSNTQTYEVVGCWFALGLPTTTFDLTQVLITSVTCSKENLVSYLFIYLCTSNRWHSGIQYQQPVRHPRRTTSETLALLAYLSDTAKMHMPAAMQKHLKKDKRFCLNGKNNCKSNWQTYPLFGLEKYTQCIPLHLETSIKITFWQTDFSS